MNFGDNMQPSTYTLTVYDYLVANGILQQFLDNRDKCANLRDDYIIDNDLINICLIWELTPEGHSFWGEHNSKLYSILKNMDIPEITIAELIKQLHNLMQPQAYEFW